MLIDSHTHIYDEMFAPYGGASAIIDEMDKDGLEYLICVGCDAASSEECVRLAESNDRIYATVGVHPYDADTVTPECIAFLRKLAQSKKVVAIGEIGLDFHHEGSIETKPVQFAAMEMQYELARELKLPVVFHIREGVGDFLEFCKTHEFPQGGVMHCFSSSAEVAEICVKKGLYISFSGTLTYKNAVSLARTAAAVPADRLLVETDCPYLTPEPHPTPINFPKNVKYTAAKLSEIRGVSPEEIEKLTNANTKRIFGIE